MYSIENIFFLKKQKLIYAVFKLGRKNQKSENFKAETHISRVT